MKFSLSRPPKPKMVSVDVSALEPKKRQFCTTEDLVNDDGVIVKNSKMAVYDPVKELSVYRVNDFSIGSLLQAGVTELSSVSFSRSAAEIADSVPSYE